MGFPVSLASIRIGFHQVKACNLRDETRIEVKKGGVLFFEGSAHIGNGSKLFIGADAILTLGENFAISASSTILCYKSIRFGRDIQFSWDCLVMDSDTHTIYDKDGKVMNEPREIIVGNKVWICARTMILKGTVIPDNCVIGACSLVSGKKFTANTIIAGSPAKSIKEIGGFRI